LFENYLNIRFKDPNLEAICVGLDWVVFHDTLQQHIAQTQSYLFWGYLPFLSVTFHFLFAAPSKPYIRYPHTNFEMFQKKQQNNHLLSSVTMEAPPHIQRMLTPTQLALDMLCPILEIITPSFRPVSTQLYSAREKQQLTDLVDTMISYGLTYKQEKGADGQYTYILDPCLEVVGRFPGLPQKKQLSYSAKQLIAREVEVEKMRRTERIYSDHKPQNAEGCCDVKAGKGSTTSLKDTVQVSRPSQNFKEKPALDFFGRKVETKRGTGKGGASHTDHPLWFRFNEGFSNAVRRPIRIQELM
jgi:chromosome transmission fidelity protein 18